MRKHYPSIGSRILTCCIFFVVAFSGQAQLSGTFSLPTDYPTLGAFVTALNAGGVGAGGVTLNIPAGYTETLTARVDITAQGTAANQIIIQKSGAGANPLFTAYTGTNLTTSASRDGMMSLSGADFVTISGLTFSESAANTTEASRMEYAIGLYKTSATDGAQNNTIQNCVITLDRATTAAWTTNGYNGSCGLVMLNCTALANSSISPSAATGTNSNNKFYGNTIQNCQTGIALAGFAAATPFTLGDVGNDVGGNSPATGNTILNFGGGAGAITASAGIWANNQFGGFNCSNNTVNNNNGSGVNHASTLRGIYTQTATSANVTINNNNVTIQGGGTTSLVSAIENGFGGTPASNTVSITNNTVSGSYTTATTGQFYGVYNLGGAQNINIIGNTVSNINYGSLAVTGTGTCYMIWNAGGINVNVRSNTTSNFARLGTTGGTTIGIYVSAGTTQTIKLNAVSNLSIDGLGSTSTMYGIQMTGTTVVVDSNTVTNLQCIKPTGSSAMYGLYNFGSPNNENYNYNVVTGLNHAGTGVVYGIYTFTAIGTRSVSFNTVGGLSNNGLTIAGIAQSSSSPSVFKNKIYNVTSNSTGAPTVSGIILTSLGTAGSANIHNNIIGDLKAPNASSTTVPTIRGINLTATTATTTISLSYNTIQLNAQTIGLNFLTTGIYHTTSTIATSANLIMRNNLVVNNSIPAGSGVASAYARSSSELNNFNSLSNNNAFFAGTPSTSNVIYWDPTQTKVSLSDYQAFTLASAAGADSNSVTDNTPFLSLVGTDPNFLHVNPAIVNNVESTGISIAALTTDFDGNIRQGSAGYVGNGLAPDIGADEFAGIVITCPQPTGLTLEEANLNDATFSWNPGGVETQWQIEYGPQGFTQGTGTISVVSTNPATITGLTANSFYSVYVRGICGPGDTAYFWTGPLSFNTFDQGQFMEWDSECPVTDFVDISNTGTLYTLGDDDEAPIQIPFGVLYQNVYYTSGTLGNNGAFVFGATNAQIGFTNTAITGAVATGLYPLWDDWGGAGNGVWVDTLGTAPNRQFIIQWNKEHLSVAGDPTNYELIIDEATQEIYYVYEDVITGNVSFDNGASATIGAAGPVQDLNVSFNSGTYLSNNSCVHFYYTDCPKPTNLTTSYIVADEAAFTWTPGLSGETSWTVIYGPDGFDPLTSGTPLTTNIPAITLIGLSQLTAYDVYIYAACDVNLQSLPLTTSFTTLPFCTNPSSLSTAYSIDSVFASWNWIQSYPTYPVTGFNLTYGYTGFDVYGTNGTEVSVDNNNTDTIADASLYNSGSYQIYVQAVCGNDTSAYIGPFNFVMPLVNDFACGAELLPVDGSVNYFNNSGATVEPNENVAAPPTTGAQTTTGWINSTLNNTLWYRFIAPPSGNVRVNNTDLNYAGQAAVYTSSGCFDFNLFDLEAANDNDITGTSVAPNFTVCGLTPGDTCFLMVDGNSVTTGNFTISLSAINLEAGSFTNLLDLCSGDTVNLFNGITGYDAGGVWLAELPSAGTGINDSLFASAGLAYQVFNFEYRVTDGCAYDSIVAQVDVYPPSSAGNDGTVNVCRNEPFDLLSGLSGNVDAGGIWYDPSNNALPDSWLTASNIPGQFNYDYISGNGVCPNDTANVLVNVDPGCNYLGLEYQASSETVVYPNPSNGLLHIETFGQVINSLEVMDMEGRIVFNADGNNGTEELIDMTKHVTGIYFVKVNGSQSEKVFKIVLQ
jgi:hypothetical protein